MRGPGWPVRIQTETGTIVGAGTLVSDRQIITCAHVVTAALGDGAADPAARSITVRFAFAPEEREYRARVVSGGWFPPSPRSPGDLAVLELVDPGPHGREPAPLCLCEDGGWGRTVQVYGHPQSYGDVGVWVRLSLDGPGNSGTWVQMTSLVTNGGHVERGFSGAGVWDAAAKAVIGWVVAADRRQGADVAWMIPVEDAARLWPPLHDLVTPALRPPTGDPPPSNQEIQELAMALLGLGGMRDRLTRKLIIDALVTNFEGRISVVRGVGPVEEVTGLVRVCLDHPGAFDRLLTLLRMYHFDEADEPGLSEVTTLIEDVDPTPLLSCRQRNALYKMLGAVADELPAGVVRRAYEDASSPLASPAPRSGDLAYLARHLERATAVNGVPPLLRFVDAIARRLPGDPSAEQLRRWVYEVGASVGITFEWISLRHAASPSTRADEQPMYLVAEVQPDGVDDELYLAEISHERQGRRQKLHADDEPRTLEGMATLLDSVLARLVETSPCDLADMVIEFLLPHRLLDHPVDQWRLESDIVPNTLGVEYRTVVRSQERPGLRFGRGSWRAKWSSLRDCGDRASPEAVHWLRPEGWTDEHERSLLFRELMDSSVHCLASATPPQLRLPFGSDEISIAIRAGIPAIVLCRSHSVATGFERWLRDLVVTTPLTELPAQIHHLRRRQDPWAEHTTLVWEDIDRSPAEQPLHRLPD